jgi:hypothetical protein
MTAGPKDDEIRVSDRGDRVLRCRNAFRRQPDALDPARGGDPGLPVDDGSVPQLRVQRHWRRSDGEDLAADRQDAVHPPHALLEIATLDGAHGGDEEVADRVAAQAGLVRCREGRGRVDFGRGRSVDAGKAVLQQLCHERLRIGEGDDAVADVANRRDPQLRAQYPGRSAVVGDGHDSGEVAGVFLEPSQQRRQPRSAANRDDLRTAREKPLLVDDLDERLVAVGGPEGTDERARDANGAECDQGDPDQSNQQSAERVWQELKRDQVDEHLGCRARLHVARDLADEVGSGDREQQESKEHDDEPALDPDTRRQPAAQVHARSSSRWKTATGPKPRSRSHVASSSAITIER